MIATMREIFQALLAISAGSVVLGTSAGLELPFTDTEIAGAFCVGSFVWLAAEVIDAFLEYR